jgi:hypothetical protein
VSSPEVIEAVRFMHGTIHTHKITPQDVLSRVEEPSRRPFTAGQSLFLRNWSYVWSIAQDPFGIQRGRQGQGLAPATFRMRTQRHSAGRLPPPRSAMRRWSS